MYKCVKFIFLLLLYLLTAVKMMKKIDIINNKIEREKESFLYNREYFAEIEITKFHSSISICNKLNIFVNEELLYQRHNNIQDIIVFWFPR